MIEDDKLEGREAIPSITWTHFSASARVEENIETIITKHKTKENRKKNKKGKRFTYDTKHTWAGSVMVGM